MGADILLLVFGISVGCWLTVIISSMRWEWRHIPHEQEEQQRLNEYEQFMDHMMY